MNGKFLGLLLLGALSAGTLSAKDYLVSTRHTSLLIKADEGKQARFQYYGTRIAENEIDGIYNAGLAYWAETYPCFGISSYGEKAFAVAHSDGNMSVDLVVEGVRQYSDEEADITEITLKDKVYPLVVKQYYKAYKGTDVISTWVEITNNAKKALTLYKFASASLPVKRADNWLTHFHGTWGAENMMEEEKLTNGQKVIANKEGIRNTQTDNPSFMLTLDGCPQEENGRVIGASLAWSGNYLMKIIADNSRINVIAGINEEVSHYILEPKETFVTPELAMTYSSEGKGGVSRAFHRWARAYKLNQGNKERDILLNSWEGVYFNVNQEGMDQMMKDMSAMGGELFVMDDGWFGDKYPRNDDKTSLGDWTVCKEKLPEGIGGLLASAKKHNIKFGIWIEPEMANTKSELFEKHPDWVLSQDNRPLTTGRGGSQVVLDLTNPEVQDFVFGVVDKLMTEYPEIAYIKWDANAALMNYGSHYLPNQKQSHIYIEYHRGMNKVLERIRAKYPNLVIQACASGGGRVNYGFLPYFNEFWTSDDTDALQRIYMQWGVSNFYPSIAMASHVSANRNHQTGRVLPLKYRFDVAMSARLGMEIQPKDMTDADKAFAGRAIAAYKKIRPVVQFGDLYRLVSPYDKKGIASLMYATPEKDKAVLFVYKTEHFLNQLMPDVVLSGLDENKTYRITDLTPENEQKPSALNGKVISGKILKEAGLSVASALRAEYSSLALLFEVVD
ncbi:alpha-galactosidase [Bacteroides ndongoniae]|jgi:alpha-galactosidase|uniref:alpha-galactosidase n=1 Tax=Bacteroides ndongoniae TaxID=1903262 RepID=UPI0023F8F75B|nr:alpha-galactosidase [Bacteroides ndongoniae]